MFYYLTCAFSHKHKQGEIMTELDRLNKQLHIAKCDLEFWRTTYNMFQTDDNFKAAVVAQNIVDSLQDDIIKLLSTR